MERRMDGQGALAYLESLASFGIRPGLSRTRRLLELMGNPQLRYRTIHVTGTNGKGSVSAMLAEILRASGIRTGLYTSPHLLRYEERMQVDGTPIGADAFAEVIERAKACARKMQEEGMESPTQFEVLTAAAFLCFAERHVEYAVIEAGLGGLLDSTNVIVPEISVITNVTMEHADRCGGTLEGIARHKAGVIKEGVPVVTAAKGMPLSVIRHTAEEKHAALFAEGEDFRSEFLSQANGKQNMAFGADLLGIPRTPYALRLLGTCQWENSAVALATAAILGQSDARITMERSMEAMARAVWPGRFERMKIGSRIVIIDGAHNPAGMEELRRSLDFFFPEGERVYLLGILKDKDIDGMLGALLRPTDTAVLSEPISVRAAAPEQVEQAARRLAGHTEAVRDPGAALARALELSGGAAHGGRLLIVAGSLYLIGDIRKRIEQGEIYG